MPSSDAVRLLRVNLSSGEVRFEELDLGTRRAYLGGRGFGILFLYKENPADVDPFSPDNRLIFASSIIGGAPVPGVNRISIVSKSPLTYGFGEAEAGGFFGPELRRAGVEAIIVEGRAEKPVYLRVEDGRAELLEAGELWGMQTKETVEEIRRRLGDPLIRVACIGPSGERLVRFANIIVDQRYAAGRSGLGTVMGYKRLKAVAVRGRGSVELHDPEKVSTLAKWFAENWRRYPGANARHIYGTLDGIRSLDMDGILPTLNFRGGSFEGLEKISGEAMNETILTGREGCYACPIRCKRVVEGKPPYVTDPSYGGPEYETVASFGSLCGISDLSAISYANQICNAYGVDTISAGNVISFAMECFENGLIGEKEIGNISLNFGNTSSMLEILEKMVKREGFGDILAEGVKISSEKIGEKSIIYAMHVRGKEIPMHEPRGKVGVGLQYALSPSGADHMQCAHDPVYEREAEHLKALGINKAVGRLELGAEKVRVFYYSTLWWGLLDSLCVCKFTFTPHPAGVYTPNHLVEIVNAVTGWNTSLWELMKASERAINLARLYNIREGHKPEEDTLPERFFQELEFGSRKGQKISRDEFLRARGIYYKMAGWDERGCPTKEKLHELDLGWTIKNEG